MWILIRWLYQKPADPDLHCFKKKDKSMFSRITVYYSGKLTCRKIIYISGFKLGPDS